MQKQREVTNFRRTESEYTKEVKFATKKIPYRMIAQLVFEASGGEWDTVFIRRRTNELVFKRGLIDLIANNNGCTLVECGKVTGRDHTTVIHSLNTVENTLDSHLYARALLKEIMTYIRENYVE